MLTDYLRYRLQLSLCLTLLCIITPLKAGLVEINFDELQADGIIGNSVGIYPGNHYASSGVLFHTGELVQGSGGIFTLTNPIDSFEVLGGPGQPFVSSPNFAIPRGAGTRDLLMIFTTLVTSVSLTTDRAVEGPDIVRLGALQATATPNEFTVLGYVEAFDNATLTPNSLLSISLNGSSFSYALFQITTEQEGIDNLTFTQVPEPSSLAMFIFCGVLSALRSRTRVSKNSSTDLRTSRL